VTVDIRITRYDHPDAAELTRRVQQEYVLRYGSPDGAPVDPDHFDRPNGVFLIGYLEGAPVATGGWRSQDVEGDGYAAGDAELKRMFVVPEARGRGLARRMLAALEADAARAGRARMVLETGVRQPEAIALYESSGYAAIDGFGHYRDHPLSVFLAKKLAAVVLPRQARRTPG
jgi:GNAT superfamily N-acetyltransferase